MPKDAKVDVVLQRVEERINDEIDAEPKHIRRYGVNNIFQRSFSYMLGKLTTGKFKFIEVTSAGALKIAVSGTAIEEIKRNPTSDTDGWIEIGGASEITEEFENPMSIIDIDSKGYELYIQYSSDGVAFSNKVLIRGDINMSKSIDLSTKAVKLSNVVTDGTEDASYQITGFR